MPSFGGFFPLLAGQTVPVEIGQGGIDGVLIGNESGLTVIVRMGANYARSLYPGWVDYFPVPAHQFSGVVNLDCSARLNNVSTWPASFAQVDIVGAGESVNLGTYPAPLFRSSNVGNSIPVTTNVSNIANDGNPAGTSVVEATQSGAPSSNVSLLNDGTFSLAQYVAGVLTKLLQVIVNQSGANPSIKLAAAGLLVEVLGALQVDQALTANTTLTVKGASSLDNGLAGSDGSGNFSAKTYTTTIGGGYVDGVAGSSWFRIGSGNAAGGDIFDATTGGDVFIKSSSLAGHRLVFQSPNGTQKFAVSAQGGGTAACSSSGSTISHGMGVTPTTLVCNPVITQPGATTIGAANYNSTTFRATIGTGATVIWYGITF